MSKIATFIRIFLRDRVSLLLGIGSLTIGISASLMIGLWYLNETSYDNFHEDADNTYRICRKLVMNEESKIVGTVFNPLGKNVAKEFPEIKEAVRVYPLVSTDGRGEMLKYNNEKYFINNVNIVDTNFFDFFNYEFHKGDKEAFISKPNSIILDEQTANKIFPNENAIGKIVNIRGEREVVAVLKNLPSNTHIRCHALIPIHSVASVDNQKWGNNDLYITYIKLTENTDKKALADKMMKYTKSNFTAYNDIDISYFLIPMKEIYFAKGFMLEEKLGIRKGNLSIVRTFLVVGIILLLIACVNFINLFISSAFLRAKAIGVRKMTGASRLNIITDFIAETFLYTVISGALAILISYYILPYFGQFIDYTLSINFESVQFWAITIGLILFISLFAGAIPGLYMSSFEALQTLKGRFRAKRIINLQKALVITQFAASIALLIGVAFIYKQIRFMNTADLGFDKEQLVYINIPESYVSKIQSIQAELEKSPYVKATSISKGTSLDWTEGNTISKPETPENQILAEIRQVQHSYIDVYGLKIIEGENTLTNKIGNGVGSECLINERAAELLNLDKPYVGKSIKVSFRGLMTITGVIKDAYTKSLTQKIDPQVYFRMEGVWSGMTIMVKASSKDMKPVIDLMRKQWEATETTYPFEYHFIDKEYEALYKTEEQAGILALWAMGIALFLTVAGLWGMARYSSDLRTKEIGIRKVNGATIVEILSLLNTEFIKWVAVSFVIAVPIAWYFVNLWLQSFVLKTTLSWWVFALAGLFAISIAVLTVSWQSWRTATRNPVEALRYE